MYKLRSFARWWTESCRWLNQLAAGRWPLAQPVPVDSDGMDIAALRPAEEASRLADRILNLSEEDLEQALKEAWDEAAALAWRKKAQELVKLRLKNAD